MLQIGPRQLPACRIVQWRARAKHALVATLARVPSGLRTHALKRTSGQMRRASAGWGAAVNASTVPTSTAANTIFDQIRFILSSLVNGAEKLTQPKGGGKVENPAASCPAIIPPSPDRPLRGDPLAVVRQAPRRHQIDAPLELGDRLQACPDRVREVVGGGGAFGVQRHHVLLGLA